MRGYLDAVNEAPYRPKSCPICGKPAAERFRPFCSGRCKDVDLHRWFSGAYAVPAVESGDDSDEDGTHDREDVSGRKR